jgi:sugar lactone lactonase YvrE
MTIRACLRRTLVLLGLAVTVAVTLEAAGPVFWQVSTEADWLAGDARALSIDSQGRLRLGPAEDTIYEATVPFLWDLVVEDDGSVWSGSGNDGQVLRVDAAGTATVSFDADELEVHALAPAPDGALYAGTSPDGRIYRIAPDGTATVFFDPDSAYVWALAVTGDGTVFAATGEPGDVYRIAPDGTGDVFYETGATHAMSLALGPDGTLLVGTATPGRVLRLDADGVPFVLLDSPYGEVRRLRHDADGVLYAAALGAGGGNGGNGGGGGGSVATTTSSSTGATVTVSVSAGGGNAGGNGGAGTPGSGAVYRIFADGGWDRIWQSAADAPYDVLPEPDGTVLVATGPAGKIFRLAGDPLEPSLLADSPASQVTALARAPGGALLYATANPARIERLSAGLAGSGTYESAVRDARTVAAWGTLTWRGTLGGGTVALSTRTGNTSTPDDTWSDWSAPYADPAGSPITSPRARFIQWRATLTGGAAGASPVLDSVTTAYLPRNTRPQVASITIHPPGTVFQEAFPAVPGLAGFAAGRPGPEVGTTSSNTPTLGRVEYQQGLLTLQWDARDEDGDDLEYAVRYRREDSADWTVLRSRLGDPLLTWDTASVPNGRYILRVEASDAPANAPATRLTGNLDSEAFVVDNAPPVIAVDSVTRDGDRVRVRFTVRDSDSVVAGADFSLDGLRWQPVFTDDGIPDARIEAFTLDVDATAVPALGVVLRARDRLNNTATTVAVPAP